MARPFVGAALIAGALAWLYADVLVALIRQWQADDNYSHGFLVPLFAAYFVWERRHSLATARPQPAAIGAAVIVLGLGLFLGGILAAELFLTRVSLLCLLAGTVLFVWGPTHLKLVSFPIAFLLLMIPLPTIVFNQVAFPLQLTASRVGEVLIAAAGIPVLRDGNILQLPGRTLEVAEACSGIRSLISLLMLSTLLGYFTETSSVRRAAVVLAAVPLAIATNAFRVAGTAMASRWIGPSAADGFFHSFSGWVLFLVTCGALMLLQRVLPRAVSHARTDVPVPAL
jgi:exosortase